MVAREGRPLIVVADDIDGLSRFYSELFDKSGKSIYEWKVMSPAEYMKKFGSLPEGVDRSEKLLVFSIGSKNVTWVFSRDDKGGLGATAVFM